MKTIAKITAELEAKKLVDYSDSVDITFITLSSAVNILVFTIDPEVALEVDKYIGNLTISYQNKMSGSVATMPIYKIRSLVVGVM